MPNPSELERQRLEDIEPWECIPKSKNSTNYLMRIGDSAWFIEPYDYGFIIGTVQFNTKKQNVTIRTGSAKYPNDIESAIRIVKSLGHVLDDTVVDGVKEAVQGSIRANKLAMELTNKINASLMDSVQ